MTHPIILFYGRKSEEDDERQVYSIDKQTDLAVSWERRNEQKITHRFSEEKSAFSKTSKRSEFNQMVDLAKKDLKKGNRVIIVAWKINRLTRNPRDNYTIEKLLDMGCEFDFFEEPFSNDPAGRMVFRMFLAMAVHYSENLSSDVKGGQASAIRQGLYPGQKKIGYFNKKSQMEPRRAIPEEAWKIREVFERLADGEPTEKVREWALEIAKIKNPAGNVILRSSFYTMIKDPFYCGHFLWKGVLYKNGKHEKIISEKLFNRVQDVLSGRAHKKEVRHLYLFQGLVYKNGEMLKSTTNKGIAYYRSRQDSFHIREDVLEHEFEKILEQSQIQKDTIKKFKELIKEIYQIKESESEKKTKLFDAEIGKLEKRKKTLQFMRLDGELSSVDFEEIKNTINTEIQNLEDQKNQNKKEGMADRSNIIEKAVEQLFLASQSYKTLSKRKKQQFIKSVLVELELKDGNALFKLKKEAQAMLELQSVCDGRALRSLAEQLFTQSDALKTLLDEWEWIFNFSGRSSSVSGSRRKNFSQKEPKKHLREKTNR